MSKDDPHRSPIDLDDETAAPGVRRHPRLVEAHIPGRLPNRIGARLVDISISGAGIETTAALARNADYQLVIECAEKKLERPGKLVWNRLSRTARGPKGESKPVFRAGLSFAASSPGAGRDLLEFIRRLDPQSLPTALSVDEAERLPVNRQRSATRFHLGKGFRIFLQTELSCVVESLSLSGALIESNARSRPGATVRLFLDLPGSTIETKARVVSCVHCPDGAHPYRLAVQFTAISEGGQGDLRRFLDDHLPSERESPAEQYRAPELPNLEPPPEERAEPLAKPEEERQERRRHNASRPEGGERWILPTTIALLAWGAILTGTGGDALRTLSAGEWLQTHADALAWSLKGLGALSVAVGAYVGFGRLGARGPAEPASTPHE